MSINSLSDLTCALCMVQNDRSTTPCTRECPNTIQDTKVLPGRLLQQRQLLQSFQCFHNGSQGCGHLQTQIGAYIFSPERYKSSTYSGYALAISVSRFQSLSDAEEMLSLLGQGLFSHSPQYEILVLDDQKLRDSQEYLLGELLLVDKGQLAVPIQPEGVGRLSTHPGLITHRLLIHGVTDLTNRLLILPCTNEKTHRFEGSLENQTGRMLCDGVVGVGVDGVISGVHCRYTRMECTTGENPRCTFDDRLLFTPRTWLHNRDCNDLTHEAFWYHMLRTLQWIEEHDAPPVGTKVGPRVFILTTHSKRLRTQILPSDFPYRNGHTIHIQGNLVETVYEGRVATRKFTATTRLPCILPEGFHLCIVRHGQGYHNQLKEEAPNRAVGWIRKRAQSAAVLDAGLTTQGVGDALSAGKYLSNILHSLPNPRVFFLASSLLRSQQTTLLIYRMLRTTFANPSTTLDTLSDHLLEALMHQRAERRPGE